MMTHPDSRSRHFSYLILTSLGLALALTGCRTASTKDDGSEIKAATQTVDGVLRLDDAEEQSLYLQMLAVELASGVKVSKEQLHSTRGLVECHRDGVIESCFLRVRVMGDELSSTQRISEVLATKIHRFIKKQRPEVADEKVTAVDVICDYIGKKSPPYDIEEVTCQIRFPRGLNEVIFVDRSAEELTELIRGERSFGNQKTTLYGTVSCQWLKGSTRTPCTVRSIVAGVSQEKIMPVSQRTSSEVAKGMLQTLMDHQKLIESTKAPASGQPSELTGYLVCAVDGLKFTTEGRMKYMCRLST